MAISVSIGIDGRAADRLARELAAFPAKAGRAASMAINDALRRGKSKTVKGLSKNLGIKQKDLTTAHRWGDRGGRAVPVRSTTATPAKPEGRITISSGRIPLIWFGPRPSKPGVGLRNRGRVLTRQGWMIVRFGSGVTYKMGRYGMRTLKQGFIARGRRGDSAGAADAASGHAGVFIRTNPHEGGPSLPIRQPLGPSVGYAANRDEGLKRDLDFDLTDFLSKEVERQLDRAIKKQG